MKNTKLNISLQNFNILKAYLQAQILLDTLDDIEDESRLNIKLSTKRYKNDLENKINEIVKNTFKSNPDLFDQLTSDLRKGINTINKHFTIC